MMKLKKIIAAAASLVMACVFATSAFALTSDEVAAMKAKAVKQFPAYADVINDLDSSQVEAIKTAYPKFDDAVAKANSVQNDVKANPANATATIQTALNTVSGLGITVDDVKVTTNADGSITAKATVNNPRAESGVTTRTVSSTLVAATSEHPEIGEAIKNGTWGVDEKKATAASATVSAPSAVIKATGDNTAVVLMMGALAIVGVLGLAVRKSDAEA